MAITNDPFEEIQRPRPFLDPTEIAGLLQDIDSDDAIIAPWVRATGAVLAASVPATPDLVVSAAVRQALICCTVAAQKLIRHVAALADTAADPGRIANMTLAAVNRFADTKLGSIDWDIVLMILILRSDAEQRATLATLWPVHVQMVELLSTPTGVQHVFRIARS